MGAKGTTYLYTNYKNVWPKPLWSMAIYGGLYGLWLSMVASMAILGGLSSQTIDTIGLIVGGFCGGLGGF